MTAVTSATLSFNAPGPPGTYNIRLFTSNGTNVRVATSPTITVVPPPPPTVTVSATTVMPRSVIAATVASGPGDASDWVGLYPTNAPDTGYRAWRYLNGSMNLPATAVTSATLNFTAPVTPGTSDIRLFTSNGTNVRVATSPTVTVVPPPPPTVTVSATTVMPRSVIAATVASGPGDPGDWVGLYPTSALDTGYLAWQYLNGSMNLPATAVTSATLNFTAPVTPGTYDIRLFTSNGTNIRVAISSSITVQSVSSSAMAAVSAPTADTETMALRTSVSLGAFDAPTDNATGVIGAIPITGWALDDSGVDQVQLWRNCVEAIDRPAGACSAATPGGPANFVFMANAAFLAGARPDVEAPIPPSRSPTVRDGAT